MNERREGPTPLEQEQWLLGEQTEAQRARTEARFDRGRREQLVREDAALREALFERVPPPAFASGVRARLQEVERRAPTRRAGVLIPAFVVALGAVSLAVIAGSRQGAHESDGERAKGLDLELRVYRQRDDGVERLLDGQRVRAGDVLQLGFVRGEHGHGVLLSIDGRGEVTLHYPAEGARDTELPRERGQQLLPHAYELDDAPSFERFILVAADEPLSVAAVASAARSLASDPERARHEPLLLPTRTSQRSLLLQKGP